MKHKYLAALAAIALILTGCAGGGASASNEIDQDATLRVAVKAVPVNLDPAQAATFGSVAPFVEGVYDRLLRLDADGEIAPMLATSWEFIDDGRVLRLELRDDVTFADGSAFDAEVAKANLDRYLSDAAARPVQNSLSSLEAVEVVDDYTIDVVSKPGVGADLPVMLADTAGFMISGEALTNPDLDQVPVGSGPYEVTAYIPSVSVTLERREGEYWGGDDQANFARIEVESIVDQRTMLDAVAGGRFDIVLADQDERTAQLESQGRYAVVKAESGYLGVMFNSNRVPEFADPRVRQAFSYAIDRESIGEVTLAGSCRPTQQMVAAGAPGYLPELDDDYPFDPDRARELLDDAGVETMSLTALFIAASPTAEVAEAVQAMLADVGVTVDFQATTGATQTADWLEGTADLRMSAQTMMPDSGRLLIRGTDDPILLGLSSPEVSEASVGLVDASLSDAERISVIEATNRAMVEQVFNIIICHRGQAVISVPQVTGVEDMGSRARGTIDYRSLALTQ